MANFNTNNLEASQIDADTLDLLTTAFELYDIAKLDYNVYRKDNDLSIPKKLILQYYKRVRQIIIKCYLGFAENTFRMKY